jgi:hypothetical protein
MAGAEGGGGAVAGRGEEEGWRRSGVVLCGCRLRELLPRNCGLAAPCGLQVGTGGGRSGRQGVRVGFTPSRFTSL